MRIVSLLVLSLLSSSFSGSLCADMVVIANSGVPSAELADVRKVYLGKKTRIAEVAVVPVLNQDSTLTQEFLDKVVGQSNNAYQAYWVEKVFTGQATKPKEMSGDAAIKAYVATTPGAIGYVNRNVVDSSVKVLLP